MDMSYSGIIALLVMCGCVGQSGGGWAHYVGQEKCRPITGWAQLAFGLDWLRPPRQMAATPYWYLHTDQWRYDTYDAGALSSPTGPQGFAGRHTADLISQSARLGWMPSMPTADSSAPAATSGIDRPWTTVCST